MHFGGINAHVAYIYSSYAQVVLSGMVPSSQVIAPVLCEALSSTLTSAGLAASSVLSCTIYCHNKELADTLHSLLTEHVVDVGISPLQPVDCDFIIHLHCIHS